MFFYSFPNYSQRPKEYIGGIKLIPTSDNISVNESTAYPP